MYVLSVCDVYCMCYCIYCVCVVNIVCLLYILYMCVCCIECVFVYVLYVLLCVLCICCDCVLCVCVLCMCVCRGPEVDASHVFSYISPPSCSCYYWDRMIVLSTQHNLDWRGTLSIRLVCGHVNQEF